MGRKKIGWISAAAIVVANMVGTGVFTGLGLQLAVVPSMAGILLLWLGGGAIAVMGALSYAELGSRLPRSGGEYHFLSELYHPFVGYLAGWVSLTVGFAASVALAALAIGDYLGTLLSLPGQVIGVGVILLVSLMHSNSLRSSSTVQLVLTGLKIALVIFLIVLGWSLPARTDWHWSWEVSGDLSSFAVGLVFVNFAYSGWNAAAYIVEEIRQPVKNLPRALLGGALVVTIMYLLLQVAFLRQTPVGSLVGEVAVGQLAAENMLGTAGSHWVTLAIVAVLVSGLSAMIWIGPRVARAMSKDYPLWQFLGQDNRRGIPVLAIWFQAFISILLVVTGSFQQVILYSGFVLEMFTALSVAGVIILRWRRGVSPFQSPWFPWIQIVFLIISLWILGYLLVNNWAESFWGLLNLGIGGLTFFWSRRVARIRGRISLPTGSLVKEHLP
ncbi:MAG: amino acid permease [Lewinellaceae bacterium]|nr:amino acid permease [Lewinellaceae bacterium]